MLSCLLWFASSGLAPGQSFEGLGSFEGAGTYPTDVNADGTVVVGVNWEDVYEIGTMAFRWEDGSVERLVRCHGSQPNVSDDGRKVAAGCQTQSLSNPSGIWVDGVVQEVPLAGEFAGAFITTVSGDGLDVFGESGFEVDPPFGSLDSLQAIRVRGGTPQIIGRLPGDFRSGVVAASYDGSVAAIESREQDPEDSDPDKVHTARWQNSLLQAVPPLPLHDEAWPTDLSSDGTTIVGYSSLEDVEGARAFRWTSATGTVELQIPPGGDFTVAHGVSGDGRVIVGSYLGSGMLYQRAAIWTDGEPRDLQDMLIEDFRYDLEGWQLLTATAVSTDGLVIVGVGFDPTTGQPSGWRVNLAPSIDVDVTAVTQELGKVKEKEVVPFTVTVRSSKLASTLQVVNTLPPDTKVVDGTITKGGVVQGDQIVWNLSDTTGETLTFNLEIQKQPKGKLFVTDTVDATASFQEGGSDSDDDELVLRYLPNSTTLNLVDARPSALDGVLLPDARNAKTIPSLNFSRFRAVSGVAADGVTLLLVRAKIRKRKHGKLILSVGQSEYAGAEIGDLWELDDTTLVDTTATGGTRDDQQPAGATQMILTPERDPFDTGHEVAFALFRAPRNFDSGPTAGVNGRSVTFKLDLFDKKNKEILLSEEVALEIVRPLVVLQHGTFDSPDGWSTSPLWADAGNALKGFFGFSSLFPFQVHRSDFSRYLGAAGPLVESAPFAWRSLLNRLEDWRQQTGYAGVQADVICHSYGGVNMRWAAQTQPDANPLTIDADGNFRNAENWGHGAFHKLITIASTHRGSAVSNQLAVLNSDGLVPGVIRAVAESQFSWIDRGGVEDQMVVSLRLRQLQRTRVPGHAIAGSGYAEFNPDYRDRLRSLWGAEKIGGKFRSFGVPWDPIDLYDPFVLQRIATYGFNLGDGVVQADDTSQTPNFDLTVSSYSSKANMPRDAISNYLHVEAAAGRSAGTFLARLTHGDQIGSGSGNFETVRGIAERVAFLLRQPTNSIFFDDFPGVMEAPLTALERAFSNATDFPPGGLYIRGPGLDTGNARAAAATSPVLTLAPDVTTVSPGDVLTTEVSWPEVGVDSGFLVHPGATPDGGRSELLTAATTTHTVVVPDRRPGPFTVAAIVISPDGELATVTRTLELVDQGGYTELRASSDRLDIRSTAPATVLISGRRPSGAWRELNDSPRLLMTSSDPGIVSIDANGMLQPGAFGSAAVTATFDSALSVTVDVTVSGAPVQVSVAPKKKGRLKRKQKKPADFVFISAVNFNPGDIDTATVRVQDSTPVKFKLKDYNKDGVKDLAAYQSPRALGLPAGDIGIRVSAQLKSGTRISALAAARVK